METAEKLVNAACSNYDIAVKCAVTIAAVLLSITVGSSSTLDRYASDEVETNDYQRYFIKSSPPNYPDQAYDFHKKGSGLYRLTINPRNGAVTEVKIVKSTGVRILDDSAVAAFLQWKAKPHTVDHVVVPVQFRGPGEDTGSHIRW